ncbi:MAG TPA: TolC family protein, partial [Polyangiaceae bacterium]|nr:TolC family protein [Polyangiaceae bacterium]
MVRIYPVARRLAIFVASLAAAHAVAAPALAEEGVYTPSAAHDLPVLEALVVRRLPRLQEPLLAVDVARSEARQAGLLPNPEIDLAWGTIPLGASNPRDLPAPLANVPNYTVGLSYTFPIGKRGPRRARAEALVEGAQRSVEATARAEALGLVRVLGRVAIARLRLEGLRGLVAQQRTMIELARSRLAQGFGTPLDVDRLEIELSRIEQQLTSTRGDEVAGLAACAGYVGVPCRPLGGDA